MANYIVEFTTTARVTLMADSPEHAAAVVRQTNPDARVNFAVRTDLMAETFPPDKPPPIPPYRGKPTPGGGSPACGAVAKPTFVEARTAAA